MKHEIKYQLLPLLLESLATDYLEIMTHNYPILSLRAVHKQLLGGPDAKEETLKIVDSISWALKK